MRIILFMLLLGKSLAFKNSARSILPIFCQKISRFTMASNNEVDLSSAAASTDPAINPNAPTFFDKLVSKQIPANIIYEDDICMVLQ
jgi:hypothetical protein